MRVKDYLCISWQGFIQQIVMLMGNGYKYYQVISPQGSLSKERWGRIDRKIAEQFDLFEQTKDTRYKNKKSGLANFTYLRYENLAVIIKTEGELREDLKTERFKSIFDTPLILRISERVYLKIGLSKGTAVKGLTVYLDKPSYLKIKGDLLELASHNKIRELRYMFQALNNLPSYAGVNAQKRILRENIIEAIKKYGHVIDGNRLFIGCKRKMYPVFDK